MGAAALHGGADAQVACRHPQPEESVRGTPRRPLPDRGGGPPQEPAARQGRPDRRHPDAGAQAPGPGAQDHRRSFGHRARPGRPAAQAAELRRMRTNQSFDAVALEEQMESLRLQLQEAEELRFAIAHGQVDAFVVGPTDDSKRVLMLSGAYARYRQIVEDMQQGALTITRTGEIMFANHAFASMLALAPADLFRVPLTRYLVPGEATLATTLLQPAYGGKPEIKTMLQGASGRQLPVRISL